MDRKDKLIKEHSKLKLFVYREYLTNYLSVLCNQQFFDTIPIFDIFAGCGIDEEGTEGSAVIAAEIIKDFRDKSGKNILLFLNELNPAHYKKLVDSVQEYSEFTDIANDEARFALETIKRIFGRVNTKGLLFIDPYGYTQWPIDIIHDILKIKDIEILLFVPTFSIYRFSTVEDNPARRFLLDMGIVENTLNDIRNIDDFAEEFTNTLKSVSNSQFAYNYKIEARGGSSTFHLFFVTHNVLGAHKFLEARKTVKESIAKKQLTLIDFDEQEFKDKLMSLLRNKTNNEKIYLEGIKMGMLPSEINPVLKKWETDNHLDIKILGPDFNRRRGSFYINENPKHSLSITYKGG